MKVCRVACVVVSYGSHVLLEDCLGSIAKQTRTADRVIVVENGPRSIALEARWSSLGVEFLFFGENLGFARANNLAVVHADDCDLVALVNPDACLESDWLAVMLDAASAHQATASFASVLIRANDPGLCDGIGDAYHISGAAKRVGCGERLATLDIRDREVFCASAAAALYRRSCFLAVGGFDQRYFCYFEDVDLGLRLRLAGYDCRLVANARASHIGSATTGGQHSDFSVYYGHRNLEWTYFKSLPLVIVLVTLPAHMVLLAVTFIALLSRGQGRIYVKAKLDALFGLPGLWRSRRDVHSRRRVSLIAIWRLLDKSLSWPGGGR
ncbi:glycosyltransferase family 2 protein [Niveibacterium sp.]|uniref:glycosyltransferase family 2 protein n=1 Tax=Niveibacterium sp. TaxID=2017444 RepID=UPI0035B273E3